MRHASTEHLLEKLEVITDYIGKVGAPSLITADTRQSEGQEWPFGSLQENSGWEV